MSTYSERPTEEKSWKKLYEAVLLETDPHLLSEKIAGAQKAIDEHALALRSNGHGDSEKEALESASIVMRDLKKMRSDEHLTTDPIPNDWRCLCAAVANEKDHKKLGLLLEELIRALDHRYESRMQVRAS